MLTLSTQLQKRVFSCHRKNENVFKMSKVEKCTCKACKNSQICKFVGFLLPSSWLLELPSLVPCEQLIVFAYQIWKPQFLSVVQFPFNNCHSPFSPTTFFEIGVCVKIIHWTFISFYLFKKDKLIIAVPVLSIHGQWLMMFFVYFQFGWTHVTLLIVVTQSHFIMQTLFEGLLWWVSLTALSSRHH